MRPKSSILMVFPIISHQFGGSPIYGNHKWDDFSWFQATYLVRYGESKRRRPSNSRGPLGGGRSNGFLKDFCNPWNHGGLYNLHFSSNTFRLKFVFSLMVIFSDDFFAFRWGFSQQVLWTLCQHPWSPGPLSLPANSKGTPCKPQQNTPK